MIYNKSFPGNASTIIHFQDNNNQRDNYMNPTILEKSMGMNEYEESEMISLSYLINNLYFDKTDNNIHFNNYNGLENLYDNINMISLVKIDAEGSELDILNSLNELHWNIIKQFVIETINDNINIQNIVNILNSKGYEIIISDPWPVQTGNVIIYAKIRNKEANDIIINNSNS